MPRGYESKARTLGEAREVTWTAPAGPDWHPIAVRLYESAFSSGGSMYWQNSDWLIFYSLCEDLSYSKLQGGRRSAEMLKGVYAALDGLLLSEGSRRRAGIELRQPEKKKTNLASVAITDYADLLEDGSNDD